MDPAGNVYDPDTNSMTVGSIDSCLASPDANPATHMHSAHVIVENVEDLVGWQARLNYEHEAMRFVTANFAPFTDSTTLQGVSFVNLPKDEDTSVHRDILSVSDASLNPNSISFGSVYLGYQRAPVSPDTPAKIQPDNTSYSAPSGGVLAALNLEVVGDQSGRTLFTQLDDDNPNAPGSGVSIFTGSESEAIYLPESGLASGFHTEGAESCSAVPMPTPTRPMTADIAMTLELAAPESIEPGQLSSVAVAWTVKNLGPDAVEVVYRVWVWAERACLATTSFVGEEFMPLLGEVRREVVVPFSCSPLLEGTLPIKFVASGHAYDPSLINQDPNPYNNAAEVQEEVKVSGTGPTPTPTPDGPIEQPTNTAGNPTLPGGTSATAPVLGAAPGGAGDPALGNQHQAVLAARGLPSTGKPAAGEGPHGAQFLIVVIAFGLPTAASVGIHRLIATRP